MLKEDLQDEIPLEDTEPISEKDLKKKGKPAPIEEKKMAPVIIEEKKVTVKPPEEKKIIAKPPEEKKVTTVLPEEKKVTATLTDEKKKIAVEAPEKGKPKPEIKEEAKFEKLLDEYLDKVGDLRVGDIVKAIIVEVHREYVLVDIGLKSEAVIKIDEFMSPRGELNIKVGDEIEVYIREIDEEDGELQVSKKIADIIRGWEKLESACSSDSPIVGTVIKTTRGGLVVSAGINCFMPLSQIGASKVEDLSKWVGKIVTAKVLECDRENKKVVISRRKLLEEEKRKKKEKLFDSLQVNSVIQGEIKRIMDYGAFVDIGGFDGLLHQDEILYERVDPKTYFKEGDKIKVMVTEIDRETERIGLSVKRLRRDPWEDVEKKYPVGSLAVGQVVSIHRFGAIVRLEEGIKGMIHISNMSWGLDRKDVKDYVNEGSIVRAVIGEVNKKDKRISLSLRQVTGDPWDEAELKYPKGSIIRGKVVRIMKNVVFVRLNEYFEGVIESEDLSWDKGIRNPSQVLKKGEETEAVVLKIDRDKRKIRLGIKQLEGDPFALFVASHKEGEIVSGQITNYTSFGAFVSLAKNVEGMVHISQVAENRIEDITQELKIGERYNFKITKIDRSKKTIGLSRKEYLEETQRKEVDKYLKKTEKLGVNLGELLKKEMIKKAVLK